MRKVKYWRCFTKHLDL